MKWAGGALGANFIVAPPIYALQQLEFALAQRATTLWQQQGKRRKISETSDVGVKAFSYRHDAKQIIASPRAHRF